MYVDRLATEQGTEAVELIPNSGETDAPDSKRGVAQTLALQLAVASELDDQDGVLARQADQHHEADLCVVLAADGDAGKCAQDAHRHHRITASGSDQPSYRPASTKKTSTAPRTNALVSDVSYWALRVSNPRPPGCKPGGFVVDFFGNPALFTVSALPLYPWITTNSMVYHRFCYKSATKKIGAMTYDPALSLKWR